MLETKLHIDESANTFTFERVQDVEGILEQNKKLRTMDQQSDWGRHVARIPNIFLEQWLREEYQRGNVGLRMYSKDFDKVIERKLRDPDWAFLRVDKKKSATGWQI